MSDLPVRTPVEVIAAALEPLAGARILDIGCGRSSAWQTPSRGCAEPG